MRGRGSAFLQKFPRAPAEAHKFHGEQSKAVDCWVNSYVPLNYKKYCREVISVNRLE